MKALVRSRKAPLLVIIGLILIAGVAIPVSAWEAVHSYAASGSQYTNIPGNVGGNFTIRAQAPTTGYLQAQVCVNYGGGCNFSFGTTVYDGAYDCAHGYVQMGGSGAARFESDCGIVSGTKAKAVAHDVNSSYSDMTCPPVGED